MRIPLARSSRPPRARRGRRDRKGTAASPSREKSPVEPVPEEIHHDARRRSARCVNGTRTPTLTSTCCRVLRLTCICGSASHSRRARYPISRAASSSTIGDHARPQRRTMKLLPIGRAPEHLVRRVVLGRHLDAGMCVQKSVGHERQRLAERAECLEHGAAVVELDLAAAREDRSAAVAVEEHVLVRAADLVRVLREDFVLAAASHAMLVQKFVASPWAHRLARMSSSGRLRSRERLSR